ncbi:hypothetical protein F4553_005265 [Allocatelliglobosispora scoriae]|uniref:Uncharacterized protein n=1 Tax=Allocatelliglobosispora scoriae TaxID=643052 RepID=A0A841BWK2_9ACTN|nr:hypothetical protein [Allocatelliglobosispora scoriae]MBB5871886.1 hypothetical protein [Allocatelliglobosispora scoriae]
MSEIANLLQQVSQADADTSILFAAEPAALVHQLRMTVSDDDAAAWVLVALYHNWRCDLLPDGEDQGDRTAAVYAFARMIPNAPQLIPPAVRAFFLRRLDEADANEASPTSL